MLAEDVVGKPHAARMLVRSRPRGSRAAHLHLRFRAVAEKNRVLTRISMREQLVATLKSVVRPIAKHRFLLERAKYFGTPILDPQAGNDRLGQFLRDARPMAA
jgi:hypothetical protein